MPLADKRATFGIQPLYNTETHIKEEGPQPPPKICLLHKAKRQPYDSFAANTQPILSTDLLSSNH